MIFRIKFAKFGVVRYIGHLDVMRYFQKVIRRSGLPVAYSQGFSPHQLMSFALPLGVGITSDGEYMEAEFDDEALKKVINGDEEKYLLEKLSEYTTEGFEILDVMRLPDPKPNVHRDKAMSLVSAAAYLIRVKDGYEEKIGFSSQADFFGRFERFLSGETITVTKKTKKNEKELNLKEFIYGYAGTVTFGSAAHARSYNNGMQICIKLAAGSVMNIKPELLLEAFMAYCVHEYDENAFAIHRCELYMGEPGRHEPLMRS
ncbi:MAG: DUF2344 domain-containing protein [Lachnospiraceae bacterium]|nr:DUF2344 domain-containing protein [Lachnospiraceae bacterium]